MYKGPPNDTELQEFCQGDGRKNSHWSAQLSFHGFVHKLSFSTICTYIHFFVLLFTYLFIYLFHSIFSVVELPEHHFLLLGNELLLFQGWLYFSPQMPHCIQAWITAKLLLYQYLNCHLEFKKNGHINFIEMSSQEKIFTSHKMHG